MRERPELVTWSNWMSFTWPTHLGPVPSDLPAEGRWFDPLLPYGAALDYNGRLWGRAGQQNRDLALLEEIQKHVFHALIRMLYAEAKYGKHPPVPVLKALYGAMAEFDRDAMWSIAEAARDADPAEFRSAAGRMCEMSMDDCSILAKYLKDHGEPDQAAQAYQRWADGARDRASG
jgi:hypothetical protein